MTDLDLADWLARQLDADEAAAKAVTTDTGTWTDSRWILNGSEVAFYSVADEDGFGGFATAAQAYPSEPLAPVALDIAFHIARWDPARVLAEVAAKLAIVEDYRIVLANNAAEPDEVMAVARGLIAKSLGMVLRRLAAPYADRPGFRPEWAIDG